MISARMSPRVFHHRSGSKVEWRCRSHRDSVLVAFNGSMIDGALYVFAASGLECSLPRLSGVGVGCTRRVGAERRAVMVTVDHVGFALYVALLKYTGAVRSVCHRMRARDGRRFICRSGR